MSMLQDLVAFARSNQVFGGMAAAGGFASALYWMRALPMRLLGAVAWGLSTRIEVANDSVAYQPFVAWLARRGTGWHARRFKLSTDGHATDEDPDDWMMAPGTGTHVVWYRGRPCRVTRSEGRRGESRSLRVRETIIIQVPGFSRRILDDLVSEVRQAAQRPGRLAVSVWTAGYWELVGSCHVRPLETVVLPGDIKDRLVADLSRFLCARDWYRHRGLPWRRGYLFAGSPGTGKSSLALALAGRLEMPVYALNLGSLANDDMLIEAVNLVPATALLLIEDIDTARVVAARDGEAEPKSGSATLGALLNLLDGAISREGRVTVMTTNHPDRIDPALLRPGRVDLRIDFPRAGPAEIARIYARFFDGRRIDLPAGLTLTPAEVQGICLQHADDPEAAARRIAGGIHVVEASAVA